MAVSDTVYLGQFTHDSAERIAAALEDRGIAWWQKQSGAFARFVFAGEWGVRLFVAADREHEARQIAADLVDGFEV